MALLLSRLDLALLVSVGAAILWVLAKRWDRAQAENNADWEAWAQERGGSYRESGTFGDRLRGLPEVSAPEGDVVVSSGRAVADATGKAAATVEDLHVAGFLVGGGPRFVAWPEGEALSFDALHRTLAEHAFEGDAEALVRELGDALLEVRAENGTVSVRTTPAPPGSPPFLSARKLAAALARFGTAWIAPLEVLEGVRVEGVRAAGAVAGGPFQARLHVRPELRGYQDAELVLAVPLALPASDLVLGEDPTPHIPAPALAPLHGARLQTDRRGARLHLPVRPAPSEETVVAAAHLLASLRAPAQPLT
ncbi:MAG: hypothetical protein AAGH15_07070 [Myxococcota bacterium]